MRIKNKIKYQNIEKFFKFTRQTWSKWKKENRPIVHFLESYFSDFELEQFLNTGKIAKMEKINKFEEFSEKVCDEFFHEYYSRKEINRDFVDIVFPEFEKSLESKKEELQKRVSDMQKQLKDNHNSNKEYNDKYQKQIDSFANKVKYFDKSRYFTKIYLFDFIINRSRFENKELLIISLEKFNDLEIYMLLTHYKKFNEKYKILE